MEPRVLCMLSKHTTVMCPQPLGFSLLTRKAEVFDLLQIKKQLPKGTWTCPKPQLARQPIAWMPEGPLTYSRVNLIRTESVCEETAVYQDDNDNSDGFLLCVWKVKWEVLSKCRRVWSVLPVPERLWLSIQLLSSHSWSGKRIPTWLKDYVNNYINIKFHIRVCPHIA